MKKRVFLITTVALLVVGAIFGAKFYKLRQASAAMAAMRPKPASVATAPAVAQTWRSELSAVGTVESFQGVTLRSEIEGRIVRIAFESGAVIKEGDVVVELDIASETAQLNSLE